MKFTVESIAQALTYFLAMLLALTFHEASHAFAAYLRGDDTAKREGRLSLNPAAHANMLGTVIFPLVGFILQWPIIGWANPVPIDERNFKRPVLDSMITALAGPGSNLVMAFIGVLLIQTYEVSWHQYLPKESFFFPVVKLTAAFIYVNAALAIFNLIPLPPLDGASVVRAVVSPETYERYEQTIAPISFFLLMGLAMLGAFKWIGYLSFAYVQFCQQVAAVFIS